MAVEIVLGSRRHHEGVWHGPASRDSRFNTLHGVIEVIDRFGPIAAEILDGTTDESGIGGDADGLGDRVRTVAEAFFQIRRYGNTARRNDGRTMIQGLLRGDAAVGQAE